MASAHTVAGRARSATKRGAANPWLELLEHAGYAVRGVLCAAMGTLALGLALGLGAYSLRARPRVRVYADNMYVSRTPAKIAAVKSALRMLLPR